MTNRRNNIVERLDDDRWVDIYDPEPRRQGFADEADGTSEFRQAVRKSMPYDDHSWLDVNKWKG